MIHQVYANRANAGDWLSARGIRALLPDVEVREHLCDLPFVERTLEDLENAGPDDLVIVGGGGLLMDYFDPFWTGMARLASRLRLVLWGIGVVDLKREESLPRMEALETVVGAARLCVFRDEATRSRFARHDLPHPVPCPSLVAVESRPAPERGLLHAANYTTAGADAYEAMVRLGRGLADATDRPYRETNNEIRAGREADLAALLSLYVRSDVVLSSRLHGCVIGLALGRKVLAVSGDRKIEAFMRAMGLEEWVLDHDRMEELPAYLDALERQPSAADRVDRGRDANRAVAERVRQLC